jgi:hypothetical protein
MNKMYLYEGDLVQLSPETCRNPMFRACIMVVTELKPWGAQGYIQGIGEDEQQGGQYFYRAKWEEMETTGGEAPFQLERGEHGTLRNDVEVQGW